MQQQLLQLFEQHPGWAIAVSLLVSSLVAVLGVVPSFFVTAANLAFFGFWPGFLLSFAGEAIGAGVSFILYRRGFRRRTQSGLERFPKLQRLVNAEGRGAFGLVVSLRLLPFVPSGLVTFAAAIGRISAGSFIIASTLGKLPALLLEAWSVYEVTQFGLVGKIILGVAGVGLLCLLIFRKNGAKQQ